MVRVNSAAPGKCPSLSAKLCNHHTLTGGVLGKEPGPQTHTGPFVGSHTTLNTTVFIQARQQGAVGNRGKGGILHGVSLLGSLPIKSNRLQGKQGRNTTVGLSGPHLALAPAWVF